ncbi:MAG: DUF4269 domain-containing protein [Anaerolineales bacterium]|nr:DUF4269 domain-containing protein [Anaerolineales bacterium]
MFFFRGFRAKRFVDFVFQDFMFQNPTYLAHGTARQRRAYRALQSLGVLRVLRAYTPVLAGTIPLNVDIPGSDLDIICEARDLDAFTRVVTDRFGARSGFRIERATIKCIASVIANFDHAGFPIEIFGQPMPVTEQNAYRHLVVEARLLKIGGERARRAIRKMKNAGLKTEPAFARYFGIAGDPYEELLRLSRLSARELRRTFADR